jgi:hypothetical protein
MHSFGHVLSQNQAMIVKAIPDGCADSTQEQSNQVDPLVDDCEDYTWKPSW